MVIGRLGKYDYINGSLSEYTVVFVERNYDPFLENFVKFLQPEVQAATDVHNIFLHVDHWMAKTAVVSRSQVDRRRWKWPLDGAVDF